MSESNYCFIACRMMITKFQYLIIMLMNQVNGTVGKTSKFSINMECILQHTEGILVSLPLNEQYPHQKDMYLFHKSIDQFLNSRSIDSEQSTRTIFFAINPLNVNPTNWSTNCCCQRIV